MYRIQNVRGFFRTTADIAEAVASYFTVNCALAVAL